MLAAANLPAENKKFTFEGKIKSLEWSANAEKILAEVEYAGQESWVLVNLNDASKSLDLTETFGLDFERVETIYSEREPAQPRDFVKKVACSKAASERQDRH